MTLMGGPDDQMGYAAGLGAGDPQAVAAVAAAAQATFEQTIASLQVEIIKAQDPVVKAQLQAYRDQIVAQHEAEAAKARTRGRAITAVAVLLMIAFVVVFAVIATKILASF